MSFWEKMKLVMSNVFATIWPFVKKLITSQMQTLLPLAIEAVKAAERNGGAWTTKRDYAFAYLTQRAVEQSISAAVRDMNEALTTALAIEQPKQ